MNVQLAFGSDSEDVIQVLDVRMCRVEYLLKRDPAVGALWWRWSGVCFSGDIDEGSSPVIGGGNQQDEQPQKATQTKKKKKITHLQRPLALQESCMATPPSRISFPATGTVPQTGQQWCCGI